MFYDSVAYQEEINKPHSEKESKIIEFPTITEKKLKKLEAQKVCYCHCIQCLVIT